MENTTIKKGELRNGVCNLCDTLVPTTAGQKVFWHKGCRTKGRSLMII